VLLDGEYIKDDQLHKCLNVDSDIVNFANGVIKIMGLVCLFYFS
jgi:hypothetical protein